MEQLVALCDVMNIRPMSGITEDLGTALQTVKGGIYSLWRVGYTVSDFIVHCCFWSIATESLPV